MDQTAWIERLKCWMQAKGGSPLADPALSNLSEEWHQAALELEGLLAASEDLETAFNEWSNAVILAGHEASRKSTDGP